MFVQLEAEATTRAIRLASFVNTPLYVVHVMSIDAMEEIAKARKAGLFTYSFPTIIIQLISDQFNYSIKSCAKLTKELHSVQVREL
jgi:dihydroorotase-like cyclic amidohydrolase